MNITLTLDPDTEKGLIARAQQRGLTLDAYLKDLVEKEASLAAITRSSGKEKALAFVAWAKGHRPTKPLPDEGVSRARFYPDRS